MKTNEIETHGKTVAAEVLGGVRELSTADIRKHTTHFSGKTREIVCIVSSISKLGKSRSLRTYNRAGRHARLWYAITYFGGIQPASPSESRRH
jgi:hypothetical protein